MFWRDKKNTKKCDWLEIKAKEKSKADTYLTNTSTTMIKDLTIPCGYTNKKPNQYILVFCRNWEYSRNWINKKRENWGMDKGKTFSVRLQQLWHALLQRPISLLPCSCVCLRRSNQSKDPSLVFLSLPLLLWSGLSLSLTISITMSKILFKVAKFKEGGLDFQVHVFIPRSVCDCVLPRFHLKHGIAYSLITTTHVNCKIILWYNNWKNYI